MRRSNDFQNGGRPPSSIFTFDILTTDIVQSVKMCHMPKRLLRYGDISSAILGLLYMYLDHPRRVFGGLYFVQDWLESMQ